MRRDWRLLGGLLTAAVLCCGCGPYEARLQESIKSAGQPAAGALIHTAPYPIYPAGTTTPSGVTIYLPKEFVVNDMAAFSNTAAVGDLVPPAGAEMVSMMALFVADASGKKYPETITFCRLPNSKTADAAARTAAETAFLSSLGANPPPTLTDFPTAGGGTWRKTTYKATINLPVNDLNGAKEPVTCRVDTYLLMTTNEELRIQVIAPESANAFFAAAEAGLKTMTAAQPAKTGT
jgi:hypothetical protein